MPTRRWMLWTWAACRAAWILIFPGLFGLAMTIGAFHAAKHGRTASAVQSAAYGLAALVFAGWSARRAWRVLRGAEAMDESAMTTELGAAAGVFGLCLIFLLIAAPGFSGLFRKSAEGAMKGNLVLLRQAVERYRLEHGGRAPESLEALVAAKIIPEMPPLWPRFSEIPHPRKGEAVVVAVTAPADTGRWAYVVSLSSPGLTGTVFIDCTHTDTKGSFWTEY
ncbi:MAG: hypothetical protein PHS14_07360 [Elusimicrobia bacterium]|nr:hypothetical protein [Elusimicrobiota bacterium]